MKEEEIIKLITEQLEAEEREKIISTISDSTDGREEYYKFKNLWALTSQSKLKQKASIRDIRKFQNTIHKKKIISFRNKTISLAKYAAIILMAFVLGKFIFNGNKLLSPEKILAFNEISVPPGQMAQVTLSDGTVIYVNACSTLKYPADFTSNERKVFLSGEAYFSVTNNSTPFIVETNNNRLVKVLGTKFNLMAYPNDELYQVTLIEGKIAMLDSIGQEITKLEVGKQYSYNIAQNKQKVASVDTSLYSSWKDGIYIFDHETLDGLSDRLERIFDVEIIIENDAIRNYKFTGTISRNVPFEQILKIIQISAPIKYKFKEVHGAIEEVRLY